MDSKNGSRLIPAGIVVVAIALFLRLFIAPGLIALDLDKIGDVSMLRAGAFTQVLLAVGCLCVATGMLRRTEGFGEPVVRAAYVVGASALLVAVLARSI